MNKKNISEIISNIDDKFIEEASVTKVKKSNIKKYTALAVSIAAIFVFGIFLSQSDLIFFNNSNDVGIENNTDLNFQEKPTNYIIETVTGEIENSAQGNKIQSEESEETTVQAESMRVPTWNERTICQKFSEITLKNMTFHSQDSKINPENVNSALLSKAVMTGYDIYEDKTYTKNAEIYSLKNISSECAAAIKFEGTNEYYVYVNSYYSPKTLGQFINDLNLKEITSFGKGHRYYEKDGCFYNETYMDFDDSIIWNVLFENLEAVNIEPQYDGTVYRNKIISASVDIPLLGYKNISIGFSDDGYIMTNILGTAKIFYIGKENCEKVFEEIKNSTTCTVESQEIVTGNINKDNIVQISPPFDPTKEENATAVESSPAYTSPGFNPNETATEIAVSQKTEN